MKYKSLKFQQPPYTNSSLSYTTKYFSFRMVGFLHPVMPSLPVQAQLNRSSLLLQLKQPRSIMLAMLSLVRHMLHHLCPALHNQGRVLVGASLDTPDAFLGNQSCYVFCSSHCGDDHCYNHWNWKFNFSVWKIYIDFYFIISSGRIKNLGNVV